MRMSDPGEPEPAEPPGYGSEAGVYEAIEVVVPDLGDFVDVPVIEVHVAPGDTVATEDPLITLESDKATMDIPAPEAGTVSALRVAVGDRISAGHVIADLRTGETLVPESGSGSGSGLAAAAAPAAAAAAVAA